MSKYVTTRQYEPLKTPDSWGSSGKRFVQQVQDALDDIRTRFGRLRVTDLGESMRNEYKDALGNISTLQQTSESIGTRVTNAEGNISTLQQTAGSIALSVSSIAVGGRNLLKNSGTNVPETANYLLKTYALADTPTAGETVTLTIWGTLGTGKTSYAVTDEDGSPSIATLSQMTDGKYTATFAWPSGLDGTAINVYGYPQDTGTASISKIKLERGNKATDWSPAPEDIESRVSATELKLTDSAIVQTVRSSSAYAADQAGKLNVGDAAASVKTASSELTDSHFLVSFNGKTAMEVTEEEARFDTDVTSANRFVGNVVNTQNGKTVTASGGVQSALDNLKKYLTGDITINLPSGIYAGFSVSGFVGPGSLTVSLAAGAVISGSITVRDCACRVKLQGVARTERQLRPQSDYAVTVSNAQLAMSNIGIQGRARTGGTDQGCNGILAQNGARVSVTDCLIERTYLPVYATTLSRVYISGLIGGVSGGDYSTVNNMFYWIIIASGASAQINAGAVPVCDKGTYATNGFGGDVVISSGGVTATGSDGTAPVVNVPTTATWTAAQGYYTMCSDAGMTTNQGLGWRDPTSGGAPGQGVVSRETIGSITFSPGYYAGLWILSNPDTIASTLSGKTISGATVTLKRTAASGTSNDNAHVKLWYHALTARPSSAAPASQLTDSGLTATCGNGEEVTFTLTSAQCALLKSGGIKGFGLCTWYDNAVSGRPYMRFERTVCTLSVSYT